MKNQDEYISVKEAKEITSLSTQTLRLWDKQGKIRSLRTPSNRRMYHKQDVCDAIGRSVSIKKKRKVVYARVSSKKQMDDLERQKTFLSIQFPDHILVTDIGSGINWKRKGLQTILEQSLRGEIEEIVVAHKDRLCRFAFELLEFIFRTTNTKLVVLNDDDEKSTEQELADDLLSIVHVYSCRNMGRRRYSSCSKDKNLSNGEAEKNVSFVDGDK